MNKFKIIGMAVSGVISVLGMVSDHISKKALNETIQKEVAKAVAEAMKKTGV